MSARGMPAISAEYADATLLNIRHRERLAQLMGSLRPQDYLEVLDAILHC